MWYIGQKIKCVRKPGLLWPDISHPKAKDYWKWEAPPEPQNGETYTIRQIWGWDGFVTFWLEELRYDAVAYHEEMFRPVDETVMRSEDAISTW